MINDGDDKLITLQHLSVFVLKHSRLQTYAHFIKDCDERIRR